MGYPLSCHRPQRDPGARYPKGRKRLKERPASHAGSQHGHQVNINTATEEELMTLPGINRLLAHNIVLYRDKIGGFRKIEDVALVTGVGATRLQQMRPEVCVGPVETQQAMPEVGVGATGPQQMRPEVCVGAIGTLQARPGVSVGPAGPQQMRPEVYVGATRPQQGRPEVGVGQRGLSRSVENLPSYDLLSCATLNINLASEKQLTALLGVSEDLAHRIVLHRPYRHADDLLRVTGDDAFSLTPISSRLSAALPKATSSAQRAGALPFCSLQDLSLKTGIRPRTPSLDALHSTFTDCLNGRRVIRVATWNLQRLNLDKVNNPGVREVICMTLLEQGIKLLAIQEVLHEDALDKLCSEFEKPTIAALQEWKTDRGSWKYVVLENPEGQEEKEMDRVAFLWDSSTGLELNQADTLEMLPEQNNGHQPYNQPVLGYFKIGELPLNLVNIHLKANQLSGVQASSSNKALDLDVLRPHLTEQKQLIILGHFGLQPDATEFNLLREKHFQHCVPRDTFTNISSKNKTGDDCQDNIWWNQPAQDAYTGRWGVIRQGLSSPWIPDGWKWGGIVSQHCPVWTEFFVD